MAAPDQRQVGLCRDLVLLVREAVIYRYIRGAGLPLLATMYGVGETWLRARFDEWGVHRRDSRESTGLRAAGLVPPPWNQPVPLVLVERTLGLAPSCSALVPHESDRPAGSRSMGAIPASPPVRQGPLGPQNATSLGGRSA
ncbi:hypothetical protein AB0J38_02215 [Streptomyces sp. NPDC050095]|uniref:hypothetical protein n=1 Tax=unclassified Streptomyces TaxID=2593676 RepID=UPI0034310E5F